MKEYWFKAKRYGYGWSPASWQGWLVMIAWVAIVVYCANRAEVLVQKDESLVWQVFIPITVATLILFRICFAKGEPLKWHWGNEEKK